MFWLFFVQLGNANKEDVHRDADDTVEIDLAELLLLMIQQRNADITGR